MRLAALERKINKIKHQLDDEEFNKIVVEKYPEKTIVRKGNKSFEWPMLPLRTYQVEARDAVINKGIKNIYTVWPRRAGKETGHFQTLIECAVRDPGNYAVFYPTRVQGQKIIWDGGIILPDENRYIPFLDMIPSWILRKKDSSDMLITLWNGSTIRINGADHAENKDRGTNYRFVMYSEFNFYLSFKIYTTIRPILRQNKGICIIQTTMKWSNFAFSLYHKIAKNERWFARYETADTLIDEKGERYITDQMIQEDIEDGMSPEDVQQEYYNNVAANDGLLYFAKAMRTMAEQDRLREDNIIPGLPIYAACDWGRSDDAVFVYFQLIDCTKPNLIGEHVNNYMSFVEHLYLFREFCIAHKLHLECIFAPHDIKNKNASSVGPLEEAQEAGFQVFVCKAPVSKIISMHNLNSMLSHTTINPTTCSHIVHCLNNASREIDNKTGMYKNKPKHDEASHGTDAMQTLNLALIQKLVPLSNYGIVPYGD